MREVSLERRSNVLPKNTFLVYGDSRTGKTTWAATFPRPLFLSDETEGGWDSIANMDDAQLFEPDVKPIVWAISKMDDMVTARAKAEPLIASGRIQTIVVDSLSYYCDLFLNFLLMAQAKKDTRSAYGDLGNHLRDLRVKTHMLPVNVVWLALAKHPDDVFPVGGPMIPGQQADKFMAGVHYIFHSRVDQQKRGQELLPPTFEMRTRKYLGYIAGNRLGGRANQLPDPLVGDYQTLIESLGYSADEIRQNLPKIVANGSAVVPQPATVPQPRPVAPQIRPQVAAVPPRKPAVVPPKS
jgi:hypothetical protein